MMCAPFLVHPTAKLFIRAPELHIQSCLISSPSPGLLGRHIPSQFYFLCKSIGLNLAPPSPTESLAKRVKDSGVLILRPIHWQKISTFELWRGYRAMWATQGRQGVGLHLFASLRPTQVRQYRIHCCLCPTCADGKFNEDKVAYFHQLQRSRTLTTPQQQSLVECEAKVQTFLHHKKVAQDQLEAYQALESDLPPTEAMLVMDFTQVQAKQTDDQAGDQWWSRGPGIHWLNLVLSHRHSEPDPLLSAPRDTTVVVKDSATPELHPCAYFTKLKGQPIPDPPDGFAKVGVDWHEPHASYEEHHTTKPRKLYPLRHKYYEFFSNISRPPGTAGHQFPPPPPFPSPSYRH